MLFATKVMLRARGFVATIAWVRGRVAGISASTSATLEEVRAVQWPLAVAAALYPGRARCLEQSLVLYYLLRRDGIAARYCQGVKPYPFQAHAWVEYRGEPINDVAEHAGQFARLPEQLP
jgi:transglutaminase-like putative cysteine protease